MFFLTVAIVAVFIIGYGFIAFESGLKINKTASALLMCVVCWSLYMVGCDDYVAQFHPDDFARFLSAYHLPEAADAARQFASQSLLLEHLGDACEILFFLMGAMTIVEVVDANGGFKIFQKQLSTSSKRKLVWRMVLLTFFLSAVLDNLTTTIVMLMILRKLVAEQRDRWIYASLVVLAANSGGAFSPIGDVTTIMLWIKGNVTSVGVVKEVFLPAILSVVIPAFILQFRLKGKMEVDQPAAAESDGKPTLTHAERVAVFVVGVGGLMFVPFFRSLTGLPPFMGILFVLGFLWAMTEVFLRHEHEADGTVSERVSKILHKIDLSTIFFFLGILMAVAVLTETGVLADFGQWLEHATDGNAYLVTGIIGLVSSVVDNVPLVAACVGMYDIAPAATTDPMLMMFVQDGQFWQLLAYCAGVGGSILIVGSAAGVVAMGMERISFGWYMRNVSLVTLLGYLAGIGVYWLERAFLF